MTDVPFPLWQIDREEYAAVCCYLGLSANETLYERLSAHLAQLPFSELPPTGFALHLAGPRLSRFRIARLDLTTRLLYPAHPARHVLNAVIALHECDGRGFRELARSTPGIAAWWTLVGSAARFALSGLATLIWLTVQAATFAARLPFRGTADLRGRRILITGANRGLGRDLMLHCLERGAAVVATVRSPTASAELLAQLPASAPLRLVVAGLARPGTLPAALGREGVAPESIDIAIACAGVKHARADAISPAELRDTFEVNVFAVAELANWFCAGAAPNITESNRSRSLVLVSSMGRWHGMHGSGGYNASKAALSILGESLEMDLQQSSRRRPTITIVEPGLFPSGMTRQTGIGRWLLASRRDVAEAIVEAAIAGRRALRLPLWFAAATWVLCLAGRSFRGRVFRHAKRDTQ